MANVQHYDALIIGAGQAGVPLARALAQSGRRTALVERVHVGGTCINEGCTPTKTMEASARLAYLARRGADYGVRTGPVSVDLARVRERKQAVVDSFRNSGQRRLESTPNLDLIFGDARFTGEKQLEIRPAKDRNSPRAATADLLFINSGGRPARPALQGLDQASPLDSTSIMELSDVPEHLVILGGGYIGLEFAQMFRRFGSNVTVVQRNAQLLPNEDADVADTVREVLVEDGVEVVLQAESRCVAADGPGIRLGISTPEGERIIRGSHLLLAAGRTPNTDSLNCKAAGIALDDKGFIKANSRLETSASGVYALGDVKGGPQFTHISYDDFRIIRTNLLEGGSATTTDRMVPYTVFIDPQLGRVGLGEEEARKQGRNIKVAKMPMSWVARADEVDETRGFMKAVVDAETRQILGCAILGIEGGELMAMVEIAMLGHLPYTVLRDAVFAHPTLAESLNNLFTNFDE